MKPLMSHMLIHHQVKPGYVDLLLLIAISILLLLKNALPVSIHNALAIYFNPPCLCSFVFFCKSYNTFVNRVLYIILFLVLIKGTNHVIFHNHVIDKWILIRFNAQVFKYISVEIRRRKLASI